ncbi:MAG: sulfur carrier protein ThiS [Actinomycetota bacterium]|nr:sulfur carrier protein ThiS [Actinomycetota bacterium]
MKLVLNGEEVTLGESATVADAVEATGAAVEARGIAAAVEGEVVPRGEWAQRQLADGERVEVVHAVQGG